MPRLVRLTLYLLGMLALLALAAYMLSGTTFRVTAGGMLAIERDFPNVTCRKILTDEFPFVHLECIDKRQLDS